MDRDSVSTHPGFVVLGPRRRADTPRGGHTIADRDGHAGRKASIDVRAPPSNRAKSRWRMRSRGRRSTRRPGRRIASNGGMAIVSSGARSCVRLVRVESYSGHPTCSWRESSRDETDSERRQSWRNEAAVAVAGSKAAAKVEAVARAALPVRIRTGRARRGTLPVFVGVMPRPRAGRSDRPSGITLASRNRRRSPAAVVFPKPGLGLNAPGFRRDRGTWSGRRVRSMRRGRDRGAC